MKPAIRLALAAALPLVLQATARAESFEFAVIGDTPYTEAQREQFPRMMDALNQLELAFVAHIGDFKDGVSACSDALFSDRRELFQKSANPFIFVPGDNEWTDCHRFTAGGYDPVERLGKLREMFFSAPRSLGKTRLAVDTQASEPAFSKYREHLRWTRGAVVFVTLNVPGSDNNIVSLENPSAEYRARSVAVSSWVASSFSLARKTGARGIVLMMQADPEFTRYAKGKPNPAYQALLDQFADEAAGFPGEVIVAHGDSHQLTIDQPLRSRASGETLKNFTRIETYGNPHMGWVSVKIDDTQPKLFTIRAQPWNAPAPIRKSEAGNEAAR